MKFFFQSPFLILVILFCFVCHALKYKKVNESEWRMVDSYPFIGNKMKSQNISALILPISTNNQMNDHSIFSCKFVDLDVKNNFPLANTKHNYFN